MKNLERHLWHGGRAEIVRVVVLSDIDSGFGHGGCRGIGCSGFGVKVHLMAAKPALLALIEIRKDRLQGLSGNLIGHTPAYRLGIGDQGYDAAWGAWKTSVVG